MRLLVLFEERGWIHAGTEDRPYSSYGEREPDLCLLSHETIGHSKGLCSEFLFSRDPILRGEITHQNRANDLISIRDASPRHRMSKDDIRRAGELSESLGPSGLSQALHRRSVAQEARYRVIGKRDLDFLKENALS